MELWQVIRIQKFSANFKDKIVSKPMEEIACCKLVQKLRSKEADNNITYVSVRINYKGEY